jgi:hypothetical protein
MYFDIGILKKYFNEKYLTSDHYLYNINAVLFYYPAFKSNFYDFIDKYKLLENKNEILFFAINIALKYRSVLSESKSTYNKDFEKFVNSFEAIKSIIQNKSIDRITITSKAKDYIILDEIMITKVSEQLLNIHEFFKEPYLKTIKNKPSPQKRKDHYFKNFIKELRPFMKYLRAETSFNQTSITNKDIYKGVVYDFGKLCGIEWNKYTTNIEDYLETQFKPSKV